MLSKNEAIQALRELFRQCPVAELATLCHTLQTASRMSVFRRLKQIHYLSSFTHAGRYYTLAETPQFDRHGLWFHQGIGFSRAGTLKETIVQNVNQADAGRTHAELKRLLRVRAYNTLLALLREARIARQPIGRLHFYVSAESRRAAKQLT